MSDHPESNRVDELQAYLAKNRVSKKELAKQLGVHPSMISRIISGERAPASRLEKLVELGIPRELLPEPNGPPGRPRRRRTR
ncbi:MAG: helix-turn-helix transcriptional regulator [Desulfovibrionaceae bacterium]|nr:helix-turn-helix transcriptional regulator [Desulfovibrionaceae bacterium]MBF0513211.1 helix-turn-helix transcriptional regulator [Desulfovibrionaceae bacterium]